MRELRLTREFDLMTIEHREVILIAQGRSEMWRSFLEGHPLNEARWYNALCGWLAATYPEEFKLLLTENMTDRLPPKAT